MIIGYFDPRPKFRFTKGWIDKIGMSEDLSRKGVLGKRTPAINQNDWESSRGWFGDGLEVRPIGTVIKRTNKFLG